MMQAAARPSLNRTRTPNRSAAACHGSDPMSRPTRLWCGTKGTTAEAQFIRELRADLVRHIGGAPSATQRILIERAVMLATHLARMDVDALTTGGMSDHARKQYLAWDGSLRRALRELGYQATPEPAVPLAQRLAALTRQPAHTPTEAAV